MENVSLLVTSVFTGAIAVFCFVITYRHHKEIGMVFVNDWIWASKQERENMDARFKKALYRTGRNVFFQLGLIFSALTAFCCSSQSWLLGVMFALIALVIVYAISSYLTGEKLKKEIEDAKN